MSPRMLISTILFAAERCELELELTFWYTPGEDSLDYGPVDPEIEFARIRNVLAVTTPSGLLIDADWLRGRGYYDWIKKFATDQLRDRLVPGSRVWYDLVAIAEC
jgi:hypothetical protein